MITMATRKPPKNPHPHPRLDPDAIREAIRDKLQRLIDKGMWQVTMTSTPDDDPTPNAPFAYTTGLTELFNHPEICVAGLPTETAHALLNNAARLVKQGVKLHDGALSKKVLANDFPVAFRELTIANRNGHTKICDDRYGRHGYYALQLFIPDPNKRFPWDADCQTPYVEQQCKLFGAGRESPPPIDYAGLARADGARLITGLDQYRAGHGRIVTDWAHTETEAWRDYCHLAGLVARKPS